MTLRINATTGKSIKLGSLLLRAGLIEPHAFTDALERSKQSDTLVGNVLVRLGHIKQADLAAALHLQALITEGILPGETAIRALKLCNQQEASPQAALSSLGWQATPQPRVDEIGFLLTSSGLVSRPLYIAARQDSTSAFMLVLKGVLRCNQFDEVLKAVSLVRGGVCTLDQASAALIQYKTRGVCVEDALRQEFGMHIETVPWRLGELLVAASILSEAEVLVALEYALRNGKRLGQCLPFGKQFTPTHLDICLEVQSLAFSGILKLEDAARLVKDCLKQKENVAAYLQRTKLLSETGTDSLLMVKVLQESGLIAERDLPEAMELTKKWCLGPIAALAATKRIDGVTYQAVWYCYELVQRKVLRPGQAVVALLWCQRTGGGIEDAVAHISGVFPMASCHRKDDTPEPSAFKRLADEANRHYSLIRQDSIKQYRQFFTIGVVLATIALAACALLAPENAALIGTLAIFVGLSGYFVLLGQSRRQQIMTDAEKTSLATTCAVRKSAASSKDQTSIAS